MSRFSTTTVLTASLALMGALTLSACAPHLNQQQCMAMDWNQMGFNDSAQGKNQRDLSSAISDCARFKIKVNTHAYYKGWRRGTRTFCQPENAYKLGIEGRTYNNICPADMSQKFLITWRKGLRQYCVPETGYNLGRSGAPYPNFCAPDQLTQFRNAYNEGHRLYAAIRGIDAQVDNINRKIHEMNYQIRDNKRKIDTLNRMLQSGVNPTGGRLTHQERRDMHYQLRELNDHNFQMREQISRLEVQRTGLQAQENAIKSRN